MAVGGFKVAIIGADRLGTLLAGRLPAGCRKVIISQEKARAVALADEVGGLASDQMSAVRGCEIVFLTASGQVLARILPDVAPHLDKDALVVNMATDVLTDELAAAFPDIRFAAAKVIGHAREMGMGSQGVVVLDHVDGSDEERLRQLFGGLGLAVHDRESTVADVNAAVMEVLSRAVADLRTRLAGLGLDESLVEATIAATGPGVLRSLTQGDAVPPGGEVAGRLRTGESTASRVS